MKTIVCYPMKSLVGSFMPEELEVIAVEEPNQCYFQASIEKYDVAVLFSESFYSPVWEWLPSLEKHLPIEMIKIIVPLHRDQVILDQMTMNRSFANTYILPASLSHEEIRSYLQSILGLSTSFESEQGVHRSGQVIALTSYGGAGVSTFCINYPVLFAKQSPESKIAVIDMNATKADLTYFFQLSAHQLSLYRPDLINLKTAEQRDWMKIFKPSDSAANLFYASATSNWRSYEISTLLTVLRRYFDYILLDWGVAFTGSEGIHRALLHSDRHLFFTRPDPFSLFSAQKWSKSRRNDSITTQIVVSHCGSERISYSRIKEITGLPVCTLIPQLASSRVIQSLKSKSVLVEEFFPPKDYIACLTALATEMKKWRGVAVS